jgi:hypothetical protein
MTPLAETILDAATKALADQDGAPHASRVLRETKRMPEPWRSLRWWP